MDENNLERGGAACPFVFVQLPVMVHPFPLLSFPGIADEKEGSSESRQRHAVKYGTYPSSDPMGFALAKQRSCSERPDQLQTTTLTKREPGRATHSADLRPLQMDGAVTEHVRNEMNGEEGAQVPVAHVHKHLTTHRTIRLTSHASFIIPQSHTHVVPIMENATTNEILSIFVTSARRWGGKMYGSQNFA